MSHWDDSRDIAVANIAWDSADDERMKLISELTEALRQLAPLVAEIKRLVELLAAPQS